MKVTLGPEYQLYADDVGLVVRTEPPGVVPLGANPFKLVRRYQIVPVARRGRGMVFAAREILTPDGPAEGDRK